MPVPWAQGRLFLIFLTDVDHAAKSAPPPLSGHKPEMRIMVETVPRKDTGGERWIYSPLENRPKSVKTGEN